LGVDFFGLLSIVFVWILFVGWACLPYVYRRLRSVLSVI